MGMATNGCRVTRWGRLARHGDGSPSWSTTARSSLLGGLLAALLTGGTGALWAQQRPVGTLDIDWEAPPGCPQAREVLDEVTLRLAGSQRIAEPMQVHGVVTETRAEGGWRLALNVTQREQIWKRDVSGASCEELAEVGALIIALAIDPELPASVVGDGDRAAGGHSAESSEESGSKDAVPAHSPSPASDAEKHPQLRAPRRAPESAPPPSGQRPGLDIGVSAIVDTGSLPRVAFGPRLVVAAHFSTVQIEVLAGGLPRVRDVIERRPGEDVGGKVELWGGALRSCALFGDRVRAGPCAGFEIGMLHAQGFGAEDWTAHQRPHWVAGGVGALALMRLKGVVSARMGTEVQIPATRPQFEIEGVGALERPAPVVVRFELGLAVELAREIREEARGR